MKNIARVVLSSGVLLLLLLVVSGCYDSPQTPKKTFIPVADRTPTPPNPSPPIVSVPVTDTPSTAKPERTLLPPSHWVFYKEGVSIEQAIRDRQEILTEMDRTTPPHRRIPSYFSAMVEMKFEERGYEYINSDFVPNGYFEVGSAFTVVGLPREDLLLP